MAANEENKKKIINLNLKLPVRIPDKRSINLATVGEQRINWMVAVPLMLLMIAGSFVFARVLVYDRFNQVYEAEQEAWAIQSRVDAGRRVIDSYGPLNDLYAHYAYADFTEEELGRVDRVKVMDLIENVIIPRTPIDNWSLTGNTLTLTVEGVTLQEIGTTMQSLLSENIVDRYVITTASGVNVESQNEVVTANVIIYLKQPDQEQEQEQEEAEEVQP